MFCYKCGKEIENEQVDFCSNCGARIKDINMLNSAEQIGGKESLNLKKSMYIICAFSGLAAMIIYLYANATTLRGHNDNIISEMLGSYWFEHTGILVVVALVIICIITGIIGVCIKSDKTNSN